MSSKLKPCPFCGTNDEVVELFSRITLMSAARCNRCGAGVDWYDGAQTWNTRPIEDALRTRVERLGAAAEECRDAILRDRDGLAEMGMTNDQTNAVLGIFDDTIGAALAACKEE